MNYGDGAVYSTQHGQMCPRCNQARAACRCKTADDAQTTDGVVRVMRETKGRKGKGVTLISGVPLGGLELKNFCQALKKKCGSGGTLKDGVIEIQGDRRDVIVALLEKRGWTVKRVGG